MIADAARATSSIRNLFSALADDSGWDGGRILSAQPGFRELAWKSIEESLERIFGSLDSSQVLRRLQIENQEAIDTMVRSQAFIELSEAERRRLAQRLFKTTTKRQDEASLLGYAVAAIGAKCFFMLEVELYGEQAVNERMLAKLIDAYIRCCREYYAVLRMVAAPQWVEPAATEKSALKAAESRKETIEKVLRLEAPIDDAFISSVLG
jgi:hypothetical protein